MDKEDIHTKRYIHIMECYSAIKKKKNSAISKSVHGPRCYYAQWNKSDWERKILYVIT